MLQEEGVTRIERSDSKVRMGQPGGFLGEYSASSNEEGERWKEAGRKVAERRNSLLEQAGEKKVRKQPKSESTILYSTRGRDLPIWLKEDPTEPSKEEH